MISRFVTVALHSYKFITVQDTILMCESPEMNVNMRGYLTRSTSHEHVKSKTDWVLFTASFGKTTANND